MKHYIRCTLLLLFLGLLACEKDKRATDDGGENPQPQEPFHWSQITCTVDGEPWGDCYPGFFGPISRTFGQRFTGSYIDFSGIEMCNKYEDYPTNFYVKLIGVEGVGEYQLSDNNYGEFYYSNYEGEQVSIKSGHESGLVTITRFEDRINHTLIDGTFEFTAYNASNKQSVLIREGRFINIRLDHF